MPADNVINIQKTAVIYFHGIGNPKRSTSLSKLLDSIDRFGGGDVSNNLGRPRTFKSRINFDDHGNEDLSGIEFNIIKNVNGRDRCVSKVMAYEGYWSPLAKTKLNLVQVFIWSLSIIWHSLCMPFSYWRNHARIKLLCLIKMADNGYKMGKLEKIERLYRDFQNWESRVSYKKGSISEFLEFVRQSLTDDQIEKEKIIDTIYEWRGNFLNHCMKNIIISLLFVIFMSVAFVAINIETNRICRYFMPEIPWTGLCSIVISVAALALILKALSGYLFDVIMWTLSSERQSEFQDRREVVGYARRLIRQVCENDEYSRVVIVSHSLGSSIAIESIFREARYCEQITQKSYSYINKISHVFTLGSPIDLIFKFFQIHSPSSHRFNRSTEDQAISIFSAPFLGFNNQCTAKIFNFWCANDPISSPIYSLKKRVSSRKDVIENIKLDAGSIFRPIQSHTCYFDNEAVVSKIYEAICSSTY